MPILEGEERRSAGSMHYVSLIVEFLRGRPALVFWTAALAQAALWSILPALIYSAPPGGVPLLLAIGHEFVLGSYLGPPLAFWLGELAFRIAGLFGVYALAQVCVVVTYWAVFTLGRAIVGTRHAVLAVLLMVGIAAFTVPSVDFGPPIMAAPFWALALLLYWRAVGESRRGYWFLLAIDLGLLLLSSYVGLILIALLALFTLLSPTGRRALWHPEPWIAVLPLFVVMFPHLAWLWEGRKVFAASLFEGITPNGEFAAWVWLAATLLLIHLGVVLLVVLALGWPRRRKERAPQIDRNPLEPSARWFVYFFALSPVACAVAIAYLTGRLGPLAVLPPLVMLSGLRLLSLPATTSRSTANARCRAPGSVCWWRRRPLLYSAFWCCPGAISPICAFPAGHRRRALLCRSIRAPHRQAAGLRFRRRASGAADRADQPEPSACLFRLGAAAQPLGQSRRFQKKRRPAGVAGRRQQCRAAGGAQGAVSRHGA